MLLIRKLTFCQRITVNKDWKSPLEATWKSLHVLDVLELVILLLLAANLLVISWTKTFLFPAASEGKFGKHVSKRKVCIASWLLLKSVAYGVIYQQTESHLDSWKSNKHLKIIFAFLASRVYIWHFSVQVFLDLHC